MAQQKTHPDPFVEIVLNTDPEPSILVQAITTLPHPLSEKAKAITLLYEATADKRPYAEALHAAERAYSLKSHIDLHILLLLAWLRLLLFLQIQPLAMKRLAQRCEALVTEQTPGELRVWAALIIGSGKFMMGDVVSSTATFSHLSRLISPDSPHYPRYAVLQAIGYLTKGMGTSAEAALSTLQDLGSVTEKRITVARIVNAAITGDYEAGIAYLLAASHYPTIEKESVTQGYNVAKQVIRLLGEQPGVNESKHSEVEAIFHKQATPPWVTSTQHLLGEETAVALDWARRAEASRAGTIRTMIGFDEYCLIRAELSSGNWQAARRLLLERHEAGIQHYFDDFFFMRTEFLAGNKQMAGQHFIKLMRSIREFRASGRFNYETRLACEFSPYDLAELSKDGANLAKKRQPAERKRTTASSKATVVGCVGIERLIAASAEMSQIRNAIMNFTEHEAPVLITGETGVGKDVVAVALHESGPRRDKPFVAINCAAISESLMESELFGHKRGAFTGAATTHRGLFLEAGEGSIFLDEIGDISPRIQAALLRVLESGEIRPVGGSAGEKIKCRIIAATNATLVDKANEGSFRMDLLFRLQRLEIRIPALRDRPSDIPVLADHFLNQWRQPGTRAVLSEELVQLFKNYPWSGNVRELRNVIERLRLLNSDKLYYDIEDADGVILPHTPDTATTFQHRPAPATHSAHAKNSAEQNLPLFPPSTTINDPNVTRQTDEAHSHENLEYMVHRGRSAFRRLERLRQLFTQFPKLKVCEVADILGVSRVTALRYLKELTEEGYIEKVTFATSARAKYYALRDDV